MCVRRDEHTECKRKATRTAEMSAHLWAQLCGMRPLWSAQKNVLLPSPPLSAPLWGVCCGNKHQTHINTDSQAHTSPYFSLVVLTHIVLPHFTIKKKKRQLQRQPCVTAALTSTCLDQITPDRKTQTQMQQQKKVSVHNSQPLGKEWDGKNTFFRISCVYHQLFCTVFFPLQMLSHYCAASRGHD